MKTKVLVISLLFNISVSFGQYVDFSWARSLDFAGGSNDIYLVGVDGLHNVYWSGNYRISMDIDPGPGVYTVSGVFQLDNVFITKLDPSGNFIWGKNLTGNRYTVLRSLYTDNDGNVYATGYFSGIADFDPGPGVFTLSTIPYNGSEVFAAFIVKLNTNGDFLWAKKIGDDGGAGAASVTVDGNGNVFVTGSYNGLTDLDPGLGVFMAGTSGISSPFVLKLNSNGDFVFAKSFNGNYSGGGSFIKVDNAGNIYTSGRFNGTNDFDPGPGQYLLNSGWGNFATFICKLDAAGNFIWAKKDMMGSQFVVDAVQNIFVYDASLTKYDVNGDLLWSKLMGGQINYSMPSNSIAIDNAGNIYLTGIFRYTKDFDPGPGVFNMTTTGNVFESDAFLCRIDNNGNFVWAKSFGGYAEDIATGITLDNVGNIYSCGEYVFSVDFDPGPGVYTITPSMVKGVYVHKMKRCVNMSFSQIMVSACNSYTLNNITYNSSGTYYQTLPNISGCDSIITLNLTINGINDTQHVSSCERYTWRSKTYTASGFYRDTVLMPGSCNNIYNLDLVIKNKSTSVLNKTICYGQQFEGYALSGVYVDTFMAANGCDSIRTLQLEVIPRKSSVINQAICRGEVFAGYKDSGTYIDTLVAVSGCDSIRIINLTVNPVYDVVLNKTICEGSSFLGHTATGNYRDVFKTIDGCDSILNTRLTVQKKPVLSLGNDTSICDGEQLILKAGSYQSYLWQDGSVADQFTVTAPGNYNVTVTNACGTGRAAISIIVNQCKGLFPNTFTPNNDGKNDFFRISNSFGINDYHLRVFNRYGERIFEAYDPKKGWDGKFKSDVQPFGVYVWYCTYVDSKGIYMSHKGTVLLLR